MPFVDVPCSCYSKGLYCSTLCVCMCEFLRSDIWGKFCIFKGNLEYW